MCVGLHAQGDLGDPGLDVEGHGDLQPVVLHHDHVPQPVTQPGVKLEHSFADYPSSASKGSIRRFVITEKAPTRAFSWLKAFTFKTLLRHYAKRALTPQSLNVKLGPQHKGHKGRAVWLV